MNDLKNFDFVIYGATGFTGRLVVEYALKQYSNTENIFLYDKFRKKKMRLINIHFQGSAKKFMNEKFLKRYL